MDANGIVKRWDAGANQIYVQTGDGNLVLFHDRLVRQKVMSPEGFANGLLSILEGMQLPDGPNAEKVFFEREKLYNNTISLNLYGGVVVTNEGVDYGQANYDPDVSTAYKITYCHINGPSLTVDSIRAILGYHEYSAHGVHGLRHYIPGHENLIKAMEQSYSKRK